MNFRNSPGLVALAAVLAVILPNIALRAQGPGQSDRFTGVNAGMNAYAASNAGAFPPHKNPGDTTYNYYMPDVLTTPVSYLQPQQMTDPFANGEKYNRFGYFNTSTFAGELNYSAINSAHGAWGLWSIGPSRTSTPANATVTNLTLYDATNGSLSQGVMFRSQKMQKETGSQ